ncbi:MAG TPA: methyltransferase domain-containing protein [Ktedonobacterales bacterium]|nr:methyltransferase domain-containing protein [Ktedonobacterales bacterium]
MNDQAAAPAREVYFHQDNTAFTAELARRTAAEEAPFLLPHLHPGMRLLDVGCGPGAITLGLAAAVAPGETVGIDLQPGQVEQARARAAAAGVATVRFEVGSVYELPFPAASFDAVYANSVLFHLREPRRALTEMRRVLRPGGVVGIRDPDNATELLAPTTPLLDESYHLRLRVRQHQGGSPFYARQQRALLLQAGFSRCIGSADAVYAGDPQVSQR